jgi:hypothetical protein
MGEDWPTQDRPNAALFVRFRGGGGGGRIAGDDRAGGGGGGGRIKPRGWGPLARWPASGPQLVRQLAGEPAIKGLSEGWPLHGRPDSEGCESWQEGIKRFLHLASPSS